MLPGYLSSKRREVDHELEVPLEEFARTRHRILWAGNPAIDVADAVTV
jgi:hypothetical protein